MFRLSRFCSLSRSGCLVFVSRFQGKRLVAVLAFLSAAIVDPRPTLAFDPSSLAVVSVRAFTEACMGAANNAENVRAFLDLAFERVENPSGDVWRRKAGSGETSIVWRMNLNKGTFILVLDEDNQKCDLLGSPVLSFVEIEKEFRRSLGRMDQTAVLSARIDGVYAKKAASSLVATVRNSGAGVTYGLAASAHHRSQGSPVDDTLFSLVWKHG